MTENQENIYNLYLSITRKKQKLPYKRRTDFIGFEEDHPEMWTAVLKIEKLFRFIPTINKQLFFEAPYILHDDQGHTDITFYGTQKAVKDYSTCISYLNTNNVDDIKSLQYIADSLSYIFNVCEANNITLNEFYHKKFPLYPYWLIGYINKKISKFVLIAMACNGVPILDMIYKCVAPDEIDSLLGDFLSTFIESKQRFDHSQKAKVLATKGLTLLEEKTQKFKNNVETDKQV
jgi:hypothetical protein